jgi:ADP-ribose pyrophosphatase YjhB (NUDIX family)
MNPENRFNIRVYGLLIWENKVLVSDEFLGGLEVTKFPGGGLEWGEGIGQCLAREFREELSIDIVPQRLFYLNDFFQPSAYHKNHQVISIYYLVSTTEPWEIGVALTPHAHPEKKHGSQVFRWIELKDLDPSLFHFPIDKKAAEELMKMTF